MKYPHLARWHKNIDAFPAGDRSRWPVLKLKVESSTSAAPEVARQKDVQPDHKQDNEQISKKDKKKKEKKEKHGKVDADSQKQPRKASEDHQKSGSRKTSNADEPTKPGSRKTSNADGAQKSGSRKTSNADAPQKSGSRKQSEDLKKHSKSEVDAPESVPEEPEAETGADDDLGALSFDDLGEDDDDEDTRKLLASKKTEIEKIKLRQKENEGKARSNLTLDVKPVSTDVDMEELTKKVKAIELEGCKWLGSQLIDVAYGIKKLRIMCQLVDVQINPDTIREEIEARFEEEVQSTDIFAFQMA